MSQMQADKILEWSSTVVLLIGVYLTAVNIYPMNVYISLVGNFGWLVVAVIWRKWSLLTVQLVIVAIYMYGMLTTLN
jgi:hypothetical protein